MDTDEPLIHTTLGNVPVSTLKHKVEWTVNDTIIHFTERYLTADGTCVRQDSHVYAIGAVATSQASFGE